MTFPDKHPPNDYPHISILVHRILTQLSSS